MAAGLSGSSARLNFSRMAVFASEARLRRSRKSVSSWLLMDDVCCSVLRGCSAEPPPGFAVGLRYFDAVSAECRGSKAPARLAPRNAGYIAAGRGDGEGRRGRKE